LQRSMMGLKTHEFELRNHRNVRASVRTNERNRPPLFTSYSP